MRAVDTTITKLIHACIVISWDRETRYQRDLNQADVANTEPPFEENNVIASCLLRLGSQKAFGHPWDVLNLMDITPLAKGSNMLFCNNSLMATILDIATRDWFCISSLDVTLISHYRISNAIHIEAAPIQWLPVRHICTAYHYDATTLSVSHRN